jgi:restriction system protein
MSRILDLAERALNAGVTRISGPVAVGLAVLLYAGIGLALPLTMHHSVLRLVELNALGTVLAAVVIISWLVVRVEAGHRRHLIEWTSELRLLDAAEFEWLVGEVFRREGWKVHETGRQDGPDGNIDLELSLNGKRVIVQCKRWTSWAVGVDEIRAFGGTLLRENLPSTAGIFVTLSNFTTQAMAEGKAMGLTLIDGRELFARIENVRRVEPCPVCHMPMKLGRSDHGWWFRCVANGCRGKRDLGKDPNRAIEYLTET